MALFERAPGRRALFRRGPMVVGEGGDPLEDPIPRPTLRHPFPAAGAQAEVVLYQKDN